VPSADLPFFFVIFPLNLKTSKEKNIQIKITRITFDTMMTKLV